MPSFKWTWRGRKHRWGTDPESAYPSVRNPSWGRKGGQEPIAQVVCHVKKFILVPSQVEWLVWARCEDMGRQQSSEHANGGFKHLWPRVHIERDERYDVLDCRIKPLNVAHHYESVEGVDKR